MPVERVVVSGELNHVDRQHLTDHLQPADHRQPVAKRLHPDPRHVGLDPPEHDVVPGLGVLARAGVHLDVLSGEGVAADKALAEIDELMDAAARWAADICACAPLSIRASKDVVYRSLSTASLEESMTTQYDSVRAMAKSEDYIEGPRAFAEKRPPNWKGR